jgi:hypothetical protein
MSQEIERRARHQAYMRSVRAEEVARRERNRLATAERDAERRRAAGLLFAAAGATAAGASAAATADAPPEAPRVRALEARAAARTADTAVDPPRVVAAYEAGALTPAAARLLEAVARGRGLPGARRISAALAAPCRAASRRAKHTALSTKCGDQRMCNADIPTNFFALPSLNLRPRHRRRAA